MNRSNSELDFNRFNGEAADGQEKKKRGRSPFRYF